MIKFEKEILEISKLYSIDPDLIKAVIEKESSGRPHLKTPEYNKNKKLIGYSYGLMQILDSTARIYNIHDVDLLYNPVINISVGTQYLKEKIKQYNNLKLAVASFNSGSPKYKNGILINEKYVNDVLTYYKNYKKKIFSFIPILLIGGIFFLYYMKK